MEEDAEFDDYRDGYSDEIGDAISYSGQDHDFFLRVKIDWLLKQSLHMAVPLKPLKVLDVGCGHGLYHPYLVRNDDVKLSGVDPASKVIEMAKASNPSIFYQSYDGKRLPYSDGEFDVSFAMCVFHHVPPEEWPDLLREMVRVTRDGGRVVIFEHNPYNPLTVRIVNSCPLDENAILLRPGQLRAISKKLDLPCYRTDFLLFFPFAGKVFRAFENLLRKLPLGAQYAFTVEKPSK